MVLVVFVFVIATTTTMAKGDYWEKYERDLAVKRIEATRLVAENPFHFDMVFPANIWLKTTIDFLKSAALYSIYAADPLVHTSIEWRDYTNCSFGDQNNEPCEYAGTRLFFDINHICYRVTGEKSCVYSPKHKSKSCSETCRS